jgi:hypothetical protein
MKATYKPIIQMVGHQKVDLEPGQFVFGREKCAKETGLSEKCVRGQLLSLKRAGMLASKRASKYSLITIINWELYQSVEDEKGQEKGHEKGQVKGHQQGHKQEVKNKERITNSVGSKDPTLVAADSGNGKNRPPPCPAEKIIDLYNSILVQLPQCKVFPESSRRSLAIRWREAPDRWNLEWWSDFFKYIAKMPLMRGQNERNWRADLMWIVIEKNFAKIINGSYPLEDEKGKRFKAPFENLSAKTQRNLAAAEAVKTLIDDGRV